MSIRPKKKRYTWSVNWKAATPVKTMVEPVYTQGYESAELLRRVVPLLQYLATCKLLLWWFLG